jgi:creatinine amidohydrolase
VPVTADDLANLLGMIAVGQMAQSAQAAAQSAHQSAQIAALTAEISRSGVIGDPRGASPALGADLFERLVAGWWLRLDGLLRSEWPPMATRR